MKPTKVKIVKKRYSSIYIHSHPFGGVEEAKFCFLLSSPTLFLCVFVVRPPRRRSREEKIKNVRSRTVGFGLGLHRSTG